MTGRESKTRRLATTNPVHEAVTMARAFAETHTLSLESTARLAILVEEMVMNLLDHGSLVAGDTMEIGLAREERAVRFFLRDPGTPYDPRGAAEGGAIPERGGGAGIALLNVWASYIDYRSADGINILEILIPDEPT